MMNSGLQANFEFPRTSMHGRESAVISIGGGKGGIGKTLLTANLGMCFAKAGMKVVLVDADLGGSNLHTCLGIEFPDVSLSDFVQRRVEKIEEVIIETGVDGLGLISGAQDFLGSANIKYTQKIRMLRQVCRINTDVVLMDLGGGTSFNVLDFFLVSDLGIVMMVPEPTSLENSYRFIKSAFYRLLRHREKSLPFRKVIDGAMENRNDLGIRTPYDLIRVVSKMDPERGDAYRDWMLGFRPLLVINQVRSHEDEELGTAVRAACRKYFGIDLDYLGHIAYEDSVWRAVRRRSAFLQENPDSAISNSFWTIARAVMARLKEIKEIDRWKENEGLP
jgi:flagellar biosynthesis protein FlhG